MSTYCDSCGNAFERDGSGSLCCPDCRINLPGDDPVADIIAAMAQAAATSKTHRSPAMQMAREILRLKAEAESLSNQVTIHQDTIVQQREALISIQKERDHARQVAVRLWCSDGLPVELYDVIQPWIVAEGDYMAILKDAHGNEVEHVCALCGKPMQVTPGFVAYCLPCKKDKPRPHIHVRCERCSPPNWYACIYLKVPDAE